MAKNSVVVDGDVVSATRLCAEAVKAAGGSVSASVPGDAVRFTIKRKGSWRDSRNTPFEGTARVTAVSAAQSRIDLDVALAGLFYAYIGLSALAMLILVLFMPIYGGIPLLLFGIIALVWITFLAAGTWPQEMADTIIGSLTPSAKAPPQTATIPPPPSAVTQSPPATAPSGHGAQVMEDLKRLGELHASGVLTDAEFEAKKAELLKRM